MENMPEPTRAQHIQEALRFLLGEGPDPQGALLRDLLSRNAEQWKQKRHQDAWIFPLPQRTVRNPRVPILDVAALEHIGSHPGARERMRASWQATLGYMGLTVRPDGRVGLRDPTTGPEFVAWLKHTSANKALDNAFRVQHMLQSLVIFGLATEALATVHGIKTILSRHHTTLAEQILKVFDPTAKDWSANRK